MSEPTQLARSALWYARHGWQVFPLRPRTKEPFGQLGVYSATADTDQVIDWWHKWPQANIGLHCGGSGLLALDLDEYKETFGGARLTMDEQETVTSLTGGGGTHLLYRMPEGLHLGNHKGDLPPGVDIRGHGGYIVLPPSIHPSGTPYRWELGYGPHEVKPAALPESLRRILSYAHMPSRIVGPPDDMAVLISLRFIESMLEAMDIATYPIQVFDTTGRRLILKHCPFAPKDDPHGDDKAAYVIIARDGHITAGCLHERCRNRLRNERIGGWSFLVRERTAEYREETA